MLWVRLRAQKSPLQGYGPGTEDQRQAVEGMPVPVYRSILSINPAPSLADEFT